MSGAEERAGQRRLETIFTLNWYGNWLLCCLPFTPFSDLCRGAACLGFILKVLPLTQYALRLDYDMSEREAERHRRRAALLLPLSENRARWWRKARRTPLYIRANAEVLVVRCKAGTRLLFFPERIVAVRPDGLWFRCVGADYDALRIHIDIVHTRLVERWQHATKSGAPDRRFKQNRLIRTGGYTTVLTRFAAAGGGALGERECAEAEVEDLSRLAAPAGFQVSVSRREAWP